MAVVALVRMGRRGELSAVAVGVAGGADKFAGNVNRVTPLGPMAFRATKRGVFPFQRERALAVHRGVKAGRFEARQVVTGGAVRPGRARGKLPSVRILMAIPAALVRDGAPEIGAFVAFGACYRRVLCGQRILRGGVIELPAWVVILPASCIMAVIAGASKLDFLESSAVGIGVTVLAAAESQPFPLDSRLTGPRSVAFLASSGLM